MSKHDIEMRNKNVMHCTSRTPHINACVKAREKPNKLDICHREYLSAHLATEAQQRRVSFVMYGM